MLLLLLFAVLSAVAAAASAPAAAIVGDCCCCCEQQYGRCSCCNACSRVNPWHGPASQAATLEKSPMRTKLRQIPFRPGTWIWDLLGVRAGGLDVLGSDLRFLRVPVGFGRIAEDLNGFHVQCASWHSGFSCSCCIGNVPGCNWGSIGTPFVRIAPSR